MEKARRLAQRLRLPLRWCPHLPTQKQLEFLNLTDEEALYGGSAGGGKSEALLIAALQYIETPGYAAIVFRRNFSDLALPGALMDRAQEWLHASDAHWNNIKKTWTFPSGATLSFGYLDHENHKYRYQGSEFQFVGFDELTQFSESQYTYLFSRLRRKASVAVPLRMRAASNPGGAGHEWVKRRFITDPQRRVFVPAGLRDNPHLDRESYMHALCQLDHVTRRQLLDGDWNAVAGGDVFRREWFRYYDRDDAGLVRLDGQCVPLDGCWRFATVDLAISQKTGADYTVIAVWTVTKEADLILLDLLRQRLTGPMILAALHATSRQWDLEYIGIENTGFQEAMIQQARIDGLTVRPLRARGDKASRARAASIRFEAGQVWFPRRAAWLDELEAELLTFGSGVKGHDDQVDAVAYACLEVGREYGSRRRIAMPEAPAEPPCSPLDPFLLDDDN